MNSYKIKYHTNALKFIKSNKLYGLKFMKAFCDICSSRNEINKYDIKKIKSSQYNDIFRLRIGKYRAIFRIIDQELIVFVFDIDSRGDIYKNNF